MRARMALHIAEIEYEHREVRLRDKPLAMLEASPKGSVPVFIREDGEVLDESLDIMRWALPAAQIDQNVTDLIDGAFKHHLDRYKYASRYDETRKRGDVDLVHRTEAVNTLLYLEAKLSKTRFLSGECLGSTDMAAFPFVRQFAAVEPEWWSTHSGLPKTVGWLKTCLASDIFSQIMTKHSVWNEQD